MWNVARQILNIPDTTMPVSLFKNKLKKFLTEKQTLGDDINWIEHNYYPFLIFETVTKELSSTVTLTL